MGLRRLGEVLGRLGGDSGPSWDVLGRLEDVLELLGDVLGPLGPSWGLLGGVLGPLGGRLGASWAVLGPPEGRLGATWGPLGTSWGGLGEVLRAFSRPRSNKDDCNNSFGASWEGFQIHFWYALDAVFDYFSIVVPSYLEIAQSQKSTIFVVPESLSKHPKNDFRRTGQAWTAQDKQTTRQDWTRQAKRGDRGHTDHAVFFF